jgi:hypothetical protein
MRDELHKQAIGGSPRSHKLQASQNIPLACGLKLTAIWISLLGFTLTL